MTIRLDGSFLTIEKLIAVACEKCGSEDLKRKLALVYSHSGGSPVPGTSSGGGWTRPSDCLRGE
jgi:hypothetical protein